MGPEIAIKQIVLTRAGVGGPRQRSSYERTLSEAQDGREGSATRCVSGTCSIASEGGEGCQWIHGTASAPAA